MGFGDGFVFELGRRAAHAGLGLAFMVVVLGVGFAIVTYQDHVKRKAAK